MKAGWEVKPLGEISQFVSTGPYGSLLHMNEYAEDGVPLVNPIDIVDGCVLHESAKRVSEEVAARLAQYRMGSGDIVVARRGELGRCAAVSDFQDGWLCGTGSFFVRPLSHVFPEYLSRYIGSPVARRIFAAASTGATMPNISNRTLAGLPVPLPPLDEQRRIVAILDEAFTGLDRARANAEANLAGARDLFDAYLTQVFSDPPADWTEATLGSKCHRITVGHVGPMAKRYAEKGVPFLRSQNVRPFRIDLSGVKFIDDAFMSELRKSELRPGDVAIVRTGYPGTAAVIPDDLPLANCADLVIARPGPDLSPHFLAMLLNSSFGKSHVAHVSVGAAQQHFNVGAAKASIFPLPPRPTQERLAERAAEIREQTASLENGIRQKIADVSDLRQSLLQKAFAGELT